MSAIEWTDKTWNPATGCTKISDGCKNCYAATMSNRLMLMGQEKYKNNFKYTEHEKYIEEPLKWKKPSKIFVNSMSDLFHKDATKEFLDKVFTVMIKADWHQFQILTKRPEIMRKYIESRPTVIPKHIWIGTSIESPKHLDRLRELKQTNAFVKFVSFEPLLERIGDLTPLDILDTFYHLTNYLLLLEIYHPTV